MGNSHVRNRSGYASEKVVEGLKSKVRLLQGEINEIMCMREDESRAYEQEMMAFAIREAEWRRERRKLTGEVKKLRKKLDRIEEKFKGMENNGMVCEKNGNELELLEKSYLLERLMEEQSLREEAIEKWKQLYFAIKIELDDLIQRTHQGDMLYLKAAEGDDDTMERLQKQLNAKEETIEFLQAQVASMEQQESKREREVDILKQSLKIMSHKKKTSAKVVAKSRSQNLHY